MTEFGKLDNVNFEKELLTVKEVAFVFRRHPNTIAKWTRAARQRGIVLFPGGLATIAEVRAFLTDQKRRTDKNG